MRAIQTSDLPIHSRDIEFTLDQALADQFCEVFEQEKGSQPLTMSCGAFRGMFQLLDDFEVNWLRLLHIQQSFEYREFYELPCPVVATSSLVKFRERAGMKWLTFENILRSQDRSKILIYAESTILIQSEKPE